jgi:hypothetical protein
MSLSNVSVVPKASYLSMLTRRYYISDGSDTYIKLTIFASIYSLENTWRKMTRTRKRPKGCALLDAATLTHIGYLHSLFK